MSASNSSRSAARKVAVQALYQWQMTNQSPKIIADEFALHRELHGADLSYFTRLVVEIPAQVKELQVSIKPFLDRDWARLDIVERSVLLLGAFEIKHCFEVPFRVVISEAIEACKMFGTLEGHRYVNGVLDRMAHAHRSAETADEELPPQAGMDG